MNIINANLILFAALISYIITNSMRRISYRFLILDKPNPRKILKKEVPNIGGVAIYLSFVISLIFAIYLSNSYIENLTIYIISSSIVLIIGLIDDIYNLSAFKRLLFQALISISIWSKGIGIKYLNIGFLNLGVDNIQLPVPLSIFITTIWISGIMNAINWIDGINGLASGVVIIILFGISVISIIKGMTLLTLFTFCLIGSCLGFLIHNFKPNFIIMGDNGSNFLGFNLSILSLYAASDSNLFQRDIVISPFVPLLLLGLPVIDMTVVIFRRIINKKSPFSADKTHLHHKLIASGFSISKINIFIYAITFLLVSLSVILIKNS